MKIVNPCIYIMSTENYGDMLERIERIGRVCYKSEDRIGEGTAERFVRSIIKRAHESVIEHGSISVKIICDRGVSHELVRHRIASYSQESTRYCNYGLDKNQNEIKCIPPFNIIDQPWEFGIWQAAMESCERAYLDLIKEGATPEMARRVLPNSLKTEIVCTMDLREWRHFLRLRTAPAAHPQIREIANMILDKFAKEYPVFFEDIARDKR